MASLDEAREPVVASFDAFYSVTWPEVYRAVAVVIRDRDLAAEAVDEAMVRTFTKWRDVSRMSNPQGWVYRVAVNWARTGLKRRSLAKKLPEPPEPLVEVPTPPDPALIEAVRRLPAKQRDVIVARYLLDLSQEQIAETFGLEPGTVKSRLSRGLERLRKELVL